MKEDDKPSLVWTKYREAKQNVLGLPKVEQVTMTLEELEAAIAQTAASSGLPETGMPPRSIVHHVNRRQLSRWYYLSLVLIFSALVIGLIWWGREL